VALEGALEDELFRHAGRSTAFNYDGLSHNRQVVNGGRIAIQGSGPEIHRVPVNCASRVVRLEFRASRDQVFPHPELG
jgi:hypothetical protein